MESNTGNHSKTSLFNVGALAYWIYVEICLIGSAFYCMEVQFSPACVQDKLSVIKSFVLKRELMVLNWPRFRNTSISL